MVISELIHEGRLVRLNVIFPPNDPASIKGYPMEKVDCPKADEKTKNATTKLINDLAMFLICLCINRRF